MKLLAAFILKMSVVVPLLLALSIPALAVGQRFVIDPYHTQIYFTWNHVGFSNPGAIVSVSKGVLVWNGEDPSQSSVKVTIPIKSIDTQLPVLNALFQSKFFEVKEYPTIKFKSTGVQRVGLSDHYRVTGELTIHGVTRPVTLDATLNKSGQLPMLKAPAIGFEATTTIQRSAFGLGDYVPMVSDRVRIHITAAVVTPKALTQQKQTVQKVLKKLEDGANSK